VTRSPQSAATPAAPTAVTLARAPFQRRHQDARSHTPLRCGPSHLRPLVRMTSPCPSRRQMKPGAPLARALLRRRVTTVTMLTQSETTSLRTHCMMHTGQVCVPARPAMIGGWRHLNNHSPVRMHFHPLHRRASRAECGHHRYALVILVCIAVFLGEPALEVSSRCSPVWQ
jgi:hypothetical protein